MFLEEARIVQGNGGLGGIDADRLDIVLLESLDDIFCHEETAQQLVPRNQRRHKHGADRVARFSPDATVRGGFVEDHRLTPGSEFFV